MQLKVKISVITALVFLSFCAKAQTGANDADSSTPAKWEHHFILGALPGNATDGIKLGMSVQYSLLRRICDELLVGSSLGVSTYELEQGKTFYPLMLETKGYIGKVFNWMPYYNAGAGYGFALRNSWDNIDEAMGGLCWRVSLGVSKQVEEEVKLMLDIGYQYQRGSFSQNFPFSDNRISESFQLQRISLRAGLVF